jgi:hypothetical protein
MEKYLKAILLYNDSDTRRISHDLTKAIEAIERIDIVKCDFKSDHKKFLGHLFEVGGDRYFIRPRGTEGMELQRLDECVWYARRYCVDLQSLGQNDNATSKSSVDQYINMIQSDDCRRVAHQFRLPTPGHLEEVLDTDRFPEQRALLVWKNFLFGRRKKRRFRFTRYLFGRVPEHYFSPEIYPWVKEHVTLDKEVQQYFQKHAGDLKQARMTACRFELKSANPEGSG